jgi:DNA polymerase III alpha subunit
LLYQEQVMQVAQTLAGFTGGQSETLMKAMSKKKADDMAKLKPLFLEGCKSNGIAERDAVDIFDRMEAFARYAFNKSHAAYYGLVAYWTAYLKVNYPSEFMACKMTSLLEKKDKLLVVIDDCRKRGIEVLPPDVNESNHAFTVTDDGSAIRFGLQAIKGIGEGPVNAICQARAAGGRFVSLFDFCERIVARACGRSQIETLIRCGAFDSLHDNRAAMLDALPGAIEQGAQAAADALSGQMNIFGDAAESGTPKSAGVLPSVPDADREVRLAWEKEFLGLYISDHPLLPLREYLETCAVNMERIGEEKSLADGTPITVGGMVTTVQKRVDKNGRGWAIFSLEDLTGSIEVLAFANTFEKCGHCVQEDAKLLVKGKLSADNRRGRPQNNGGDDDEQSGEEAVVYKIMADDITEIPADAAEQVVRAPRARKRKTQPTVEPEPVPTVEASTPVPPAWLTTNDDNPMNAENTPNNDNPIDPSSNGGISITRRSVDAEVTSTPLSPPNPSPPPCASGFVPPEEASHCVHLHIAEEQASQDVLMKLWNICKAHPGQTEVWLHIDNGIETLQLKVSPAYFVVPTPQFCDEALAVLGEGRVLVPQ